MGFKSISAKLDDLIENAGGCAVVDGGFATQLEIHGASINDPLWSALCLIKEPHLIKQVHMEYLEAGADILVTSSYQATLPGFVSRGLSMEEAELLLERSVKLAVDARNNFWKVVKNTTNHGYNQALVAASIGSYGTYLADGSEYSGNYGHDVNLGKLKDFHRRRLQVLVNAGPDMLALETIPNKLEAQACVELLEEENVNIPSWICFSSADGVNGPSGESFQQQQRNSNFSNKWGRVPVRSGGLVRKKTDNICNFWIQGFCKFDDRCKYINLASEVGCMLSEGPWVFVGLQNGVKAWNVQTATELSVDAPGGQVYAFVVGNDFLFAGTQVGTILAWQYKVPTNSFEPAASLNGHTLAVITLVVGANRIYSGSMDNSIRVWSLETLQCVQTLNEHSSVVMSVLCWDQFLLSCSLDKTIKVWVASESGNLEVTYTHNEEHGLLTLCGMHDAESKPVLLCASNDNTIRVYDLPSFSERGRIYSKQEVRTIQIGPGGLFFTGDGTGEVKVWKWVDEATSTA